ncbi:MAG: hypothetical protein CSH49_16645 [Alcanivorax sp.]|nr:MAG: hypothetical protein CSH49_16645 [Alcanivorax sp.]
MSYRYSKPIDTLIDQMDKAAGAPSPLCETDFLIVGSGYGGAIAAARLAGAQGGSTPNGPRVIVLERGQEYQTGEFPNSINILPKHIRINGAQYVYPLGYPEALFDVHIGRNVDVLVGSGLGGTSLINANVAFRPEMDFFEKPGWPRDLTLHPGLENGFKAVTRILQPNTVPDDRAKEFNKAAALQKLARKLGGRKHIAAANITVNFVDGARNAVGLPQPECTGCGNCITGCNVGAKNTLMTNYIPLAEARGATFYTGATVLSIEPITDNPARRWRVYLVRTQSIKTPLESEVFSIETSNLILAAGTLGSTEILQRSEKLEQLKLKNDNLGQHFSTNGDAIAFSYGQKQQVNSVGTKHYQNHYRCGPTITTLSFFQTDDKRQVLLEDGSVPAALAEIFYQTMPHLSLIQGLGHGTQPKYFHKHKNLDPLIAYQEVQHYNQTLLLMTDDQCKGSLEFHTYDNTADAIFQRSTRTDEPQRLTLFNIGKCVPHWDVDRNDSPSHLQSIHSAMATENFKSGFEGGQYIPNPFWNLVPESANAFMEGNFNTGRLLTVHPLGGCRMADNGALGVVNHQCQVFKGEGIDTHPGLYVMDGAIIPVALGINPFLTIAALSWRATQFLLEENGLTESLITYAEPQPQVPPTPTEPPPVRKDRDHKTTLQLQERMVGEIKADQAMKDAILSLLNIKNSAASNNNATVEQNRLFEKFGLVLDIQYQPVQFTDLLEQGQALTFSVKMYQNSESAASVISNHSYGVPREHLTQRDLLAEGSGTFRFMVPDSPGWFKRKARIVRALHAYIKRRAGIKELWRERRAKKHKPSKAKKRQVSLLKQIRGFSKVAAMQSTYRELIYDMTLRPREQPSNDPNRQLSITGRKTLAWTLNHPRLLESLLVLNTQLSIPAVRGKASARLVVDMDHFSNDGLLQAQGQANTPAALFEATTLAGMFARGVFQTSFWEFGSGGYPDDELPTPEHVPTLRYQVDGKALTITPQTHKLVVPHSKDSALNIPLQLHRYGQPGRPPLLLLHGLAQGSGIFTTTTLETNMVQYFLGEKFDVWVLDYRISNRIFPKLSKELKTGWAIDEIAAFDIKDAIDHIYSACNQKIAVIAHCVGSVAIQMAILSGLVGKDRIAAYISNAIHPWLAPSAANRVRSRIGNYVEITMVDGLLDPVPRPDDRNSALKTLTDRLAFACARIAENQTNGHPLPSSPEESIQQAICDRLTLLYGRMWNHFNLAPATRMHWHELVGPAPVAVYQQLYYMISRNRLLSSDGENSYLLTTNLQQYWQGIPTLLIHGEDNKVFNPKSASNSQFFLHKVLGDTSTPVWYWRRKNYGHMDMIIGQHAARDIFPILKDFINPPHKPPLQTTDHQQYMGHDRADPKPRTKAILRSARREGDHLILHYWMELSPFNTSITHEPRVENLQPIEPPTFAAVRGGDDMSMIEAHLVIHPENYRKPSFQATFDRFDLKEFDPGLDAGQSTHTNSFPDIVLTIKGDNGMAPADLPHWVRSRFERAPRVFTFLCGSCRYPGTPIERTLSDRIFARMWQQATQHHAEAVFMLGDQIYADASADLFDSGNWRDRYDKRYRDAFNTSHFSRLASDFPTYFCVDDHEYADNWSGDGDGSLDSDSLLNIEVGHLSIRQYEYANKRARWFMGYGLGTQRRLWKALAAEEFVCPAFIMDTRSEREVRRKGVCANMLHDAQLNALLQWLDQNRSNDAPKLIFAGVGLAPVNHNLLQHQELWRVEEGFWGYPQTLGKIMDAIAQSNVKRLVFFSGDLHLSCHAEIRLHSVAKATGAETESRLQQVVSSGFFAPLPFANSTADEYQWNTWVTCPAIESEQFRHTLQYRATLLSDDLSQFMRVSFDQDQDQRWQMKLFVENGQAQPCGEQIVALGD